MQSYCFRHSMSVVSNAGTEHSNLPFFSIWQVDSNQGFSWVLFLLEIKKDNCTSLMQKDYNKRGVYCMIISTEINQQKCTSLKQKDYNKRGVYCMIISTEINQQKCPHWSLRIECCSWLLLWYNHTYFWINMFFCQSLSFALPQFSSVLFFK